MVTVTMSKKFTLYCHETMSEKIEKKLSKHNVEYHKRPMTYKGKVIPRIQYKCRIDMTNDDKCVDDFINDIKSSYDNTKNLIRINIEEWTFI